MSWDHPDRHRFSRLSPVISDDRVDRVLDTVMARLDRQVVVKPSTWVAIGTWLSEMIPAPRFAMPMAAAMVLGVLVGQQLEAADRAMEFTSLITYTTTYTSGF